MPVAPAIAIAGMVRSILPTAKLANRLVPPLAMGIATPWQPVAIAYKKAVRYVTRPACRPSAELARHAMPLVAPVLELIAAMVHLMPESNATTALPTALVPRLARQAALIILAQIVATERSMRVSSVTELPALPEEIPLVAMEAAR